MNPWREVLKALQAELDRLSQEIEGRSVLPNGVTAVLPAARFERWAPILTAVTAELGEALVEWVGASRRTWYADAGPFLTVRLDAERTRSEISCHFLKSPPGESPATEEEPVARDSPVAESVAEPVTESSPVAAEASYEPAIREDTASGDISALSRFELDSSENGAEDQELQLSQIELD
ncbi:MAG: hypothetical protein V3T72_18810 [Thermoanaerobaculia bacterium]